MLQQCYNLFAKRCYSSPTRNSAHQRQTVMKSLLLATSLILGFGGTAVAADAVEDVVIVDEGYNWSGVYVGVQGGYGWGDNDYGYESDRVGFDSDGFVGGLTAGANWQNGSFVYGVEADISYSDVDG